METNSTSLEDDLEDDPIIDQDTATQALKGIEETLQPLDKTGKLPEPARTKVDAREEPTQDLSGTHRDQTGEEETMATES